MKIMIASDIHGSDIYCSQMISAFERENAEKLLLLGDILYHGPRNALPDSYEPKGVIDRLNSVKDKILCVRGNCDAEVDQMVLEFPISADYCILYAEGRTIFATHGHLYNEAKLPPIQSFDVLLHGHTHVPNCTKHENYLYINPGSVSIPKGGSSHSYMTLDDGLLEWKRLDGEVYMNYRLEKLK